MRAQKGFTLVEIMVVVAIIGLLAAIGIPNLLRTRMTANESVTKKDLRTFSTANEAYRAAQNPMAYAPAIANLIGDTPPYLDNSWSNNPRHGFNLSYASGGVTGYALFADALPNEAQNDYCVDQTGVVYSNGTGDANGCTGGLPIP